MRKIDIHCHTTKSILKGIIPKSATLESIEHEMRIHNIELTMLLASYFPKQGKGISNYHVLHWLKGKPAFKLIGSLDFQYFFSTGIRELTELAEDNHLAGIKIYSGYQDIRYSSKQFHQVAELAAKHQLLLMFHGGYIQCHESDKDMAVSPHEIAAIAHQYPSIPIIISHLAWPFVDELIQVTLSYDNIFTDSSGMLDSFKTSHTFDACVEGIKRFLGECGPERILFGTDFPIQSHIDSIRLIEQAMIDYSFNDKKCVYFNNAKKLLKQNILVNE